MTYVYYAGLRSDALNSQKTHTPYLGLYSPSGKTSYRQISFLTVTSYPSVTFMYVYKVLGFCLTNSVYMLVFYWSLSEHVLWCLNKMVDIAVKVFNCSFFKGKFSSLIQISVKFVPVGLTISEHWFWVLVRAEQATTGPVTWTMQCWGGRGRVWTPLPPGFNSPTPAQCLFFLTPSPFFPYFFSGTPVQNWDFFAIAPAPLSSPTAVIATCIWRQKATTRSKDLQIPAFCSITSLQWIKTFMQFMYFCNAPMSSKDLHSSCVLQGPGDSKDLNNSRILHGHNEFEGFAQFM